MVNAAGRALCFQRPGWFLAGGGAGALARRPGGGLGPGPGPFGLGRGLAAVAAGIWRRLGLGPRRRADVLGRRVGAEGDGGGWAWSGERAAASGPAPVPSGLGFGPGPGLVAGIWRRLGLAVRGGGCGAAALARAMPKES